MLLLDFELKRQIIIKVSKAVTSKLNFSKLNLNCCKLKSTRCGSFDLTVKFHYQKCELRNGWRDVYSKSIAVIMELIVNPIYWQKLHRFKCSKVSAWHRCVGCIASYSSSHLLLYTRVAPTCVSPSLAAPSGVRSACTTPVLIIGCYTLPCFAQDCAEYSFNCMPLKIIIC